MLTENERLWLKLRSMGEYCTWCPIPMLDCADMCAEGRCPTRSGDMMDVAVFEARVAAKLATLFQYITMDSPYDHEQEIPCNDCPMEHKCTLDCRESVLKYARLDTEEEMDAD